MARNLGREIVSRAKRSQIMASVRQRNTKPEIVLRSRLHRAGYRFRLHPVGLPGTPDIILPKYRYAIFVHGCFWHRHPSCRKATTPTQNRAFWLDKFTKNVERDERKKRELENAGWRVLVVWECEIVERVEDTLVKVREFLEEHGECVEPPQSIANAFDPHEEDRR